VSICRILEQTHGLRFAMMGRDPHVLGVDGREQARKRVDEHRTELAAEVRTDDLIARCQRFARLAVRRVR